VGAVSPGGPASATTPAADTLTGEGGTFAENIIDKLLVDGNSQLAGLTGSYTNVNVDTGRSDFASGQADFAVSEFPLTSDEQSTASAQQRSFAYVPFAASPVAIAGFVECSNDATFKPTTVCPGIQLTLEQLAKLFTQQIAWNAPGLSTQSIAPISNNDDDVTRLVMADPSASTYQLIAAFDSDPNAKSAWDAYINGLPGGLSDQPAEVWPTHQGVSDADTGVLDAIEPLNSSSVPYPPSAWTYGSLAPVPGDWLGAPWNLQANGMTFPIENGAGAYVAPTEAAAAASLADATMDPKTNLVTFTNSTTDKAAYPIMVMSYLIVPTSGLSSTKATALSNFINFVLGSTGQSDIEALGAAPVTGAMQQAGEAVAKEVASQSSQSGSSGTTPAVSSSGGTSTSSSGGTGTSGSSGSSSSASGGSGSSGSSDTSDTSGSSGGSLAYTGAAPMPALIAGGVLAVLGAAMRRRMRRRIGRRLLPLEAEVQ
jgi:ABC-type phosphate transport system substrate-binding protein